LDIESECSPNDDFREDLLDSDIPYQKKLIIIHAMDLPLLASIPSRATKVGTILARTRAEVRESDADAAVAIVVNTRPINSQILLLNKFQKILDNQQVMNAVTMAGCRGVRWNALPSNGCWRTLPRG
jgi:hypothetical protein